MPTDAIDGKGRFRRRQWLKMFSQLVVEVVKRVDARFGPRLHFAYPARLLADVLFACSMFLFFNRRPLSCYGKLFWRHMLYFIQLIKVVYCLRFLLVELVFRELKTVFCLIKHYAKPAFDSVGIWQTSLSPCSLKFVYLVLYIIFIFLNIAIEHKLEQLIFWLWKKYRKGFYMNNVFQTNAIPHYHRVQRRRRTRRHSYFLTMDPPPGYTNYPWRTTRSGKRFWTHYGSLFPSSLSLISFHYRHFGGCSNIRSVDRSVCCKQDRETWQDVSEGSGAVQT